MEEKKKINIRFNILAIITIIIFCFALTPKTLQNDTFYTIKIGEDIINNNGIDMKDHYSWHENLPYTYPHWAYDCGIYLIYHLGEITGLPDGGMLFIYISTIVLASTLGVLLYCVNNKLTKNKLVSYIVTLLSIFVLKPYIAARAQLLTFILFVLTILFIECFLENKKKKYLIGLVLISLIIANIHVAVWPFFFILFLPYIAEYIIATIAEKNIISRLMIFNQKDIIKRLNKKTNKIDDSVKREKVNIKIQKAQEKLKLEEEKFENKKEKSLKQKEKPYKIKISKNNAVKWLILVMVICALMGLITPLGDTPYTYLIKTMQGNTTSSISEHLPLTLFNDKETMIVLTLFIIMLTFTDTKIKLTDLFMLGGIVYLVFMSRRQISMLIIICGFIFAKLLTYLIEKYDKEGCNKFIKVMTSIPGKICTLGFIIIISFVLFQPKIKSDYIDKKSYPIDAAVWMKENLNLSEIKLFNEYNYGSYLLYQGIPVFIDSRADLYAPEFNGQKNEEGKLEGRDIFTDYMNISSIGVYYENKFEDYGITHIITKQVSKINMFLSRDSDYKELYSDDNFIIYERNK